MLAKRVIPCLDIRDGRIVKGVQFQSLRDSGDPATRAAKYEEMGADELVILDVSATLEGRKTSLDVIEKVRQAIRIPLTVGGGVRSVADALQLLEAGADKVAVNTAAVQRPKLITELSRRYGAQCVVAAIDARAKDDSWEVVTHAGKQPTGLDVIEWSRKVEELGAGEILLTSMDRDGTQSGYDLALLQEVSEAVGIPVIASGGAANAADMSAAFDAGADAVLAASIFHDDQPNAKTIWQELAEFGWEVRR